MNEEGLMHEMSLGGVLCLSRILLMWLFLSHLWSERGIVGLCIPVCNEGLSATD